MFSFNCEFFDYSYNNKIPQRIDSLSFSLSLSLISIIIIDQFDFRTACSLISHTQGCATLHLYICAIPMVLLDWLERFKDRHVRRGCAAWFTDRANVLSFCRKARRKEKDAGATEDPKLYLEEAALERQLPELDLRMLVDLPPGLDYNEWLASHTLALFDHINLVYGTISEFCTMTGCPDMTGPGLRYLVNSVFFFQLFAISKKLHLWFTRAYLRELYFCLL